MPHPTHERAMDTPLHQGFFPSCREVRVGHPSLFHAILEVEPPPLALLLVHAHPSCTTEEFEDEKAGEENARVDRLLSGLRPQT